jgi:hypothetical protein
MFQQLTERLQYPPVGDVVDVVQHQDHRMRKIGQGGADQQDLVGAELGGRHDLPQGAIGGHRVADGQGTENVGPERCNVVVGLLHGQPRHHDRGNAGWGGTGWGGTVRCSPLVVPGRQRQRLPAAGSGAQHGHRMGGPCGQLIQQPLPVHEPRRKGRRKCPQAEQAG